jgi:nicotinate-nucleotide pyrophosphorylase (carboxylating)
LERAKLIELAYQRGKELNLNNRNYLSWLEKFFDQEYQEDIGSGDITSEAILTKNKVGQAVLKAKQSGIVGGIEEASWFYKKHGLKVKTHNEDAETVKKGDTILEVYGERKDILATERIGLNVLQRMSGIATETKRLVDLLKGYKTRIAATRKTHSRYLDKKAVFLGGGLTHRLGLWDSILIKDNHLESLKRDGIKNPVEKAITLASRFAEKVGFIEIETTNQDDAIKAAKKFKQLKLKKSCVIMLDNLASNEIGHIIEALKSESLYEYVLLEASGNITSDNITEYAKTGVNVVSLGYLTHSAKIFDMSLEMTL